MSDGPPPAPRVSALLVTSLAASAVSLLLPTAFGPFGPLGAGVLAFAGYGAVRKSGGAIRGPRLAAVAMTAALAVLVLMGISIVRGARPAAALAAMSRSVAEVESALRTGTPEGIWDLLAPRAREGRDRAAFVERLRTPLARLGPLDAMREERHPGEDWNRLGDLADGTVLRLPVDVDAKFRGGAALLHLEFRVTCEGGRAGAELVEVAIHDPPR